jgi:glutathione S-transferase
MALVYCGIRIELREVKLSAMPASMLQLSPKATVPVLDLSDGQVIDESLDIMLWSLSRTDPDQWLDIDETSKQLIQRIDTEFKPLLLQPYLSGHRLRLTDVAIFPFIRQFAGVDPSWFEHCDYASVRNWLNAMLGSDLFQRVMQKNPFWQPGDAAIYL